MDGSSSYDQVKVNHGPQSPGQSGLVAFVRPNFPGWAGTVRQISLDGARLGLNLENVLSKMAEK
mgnify:CR=1 FL=1